MPASQPTPPSSTSSNNASPNDQQFRVVRKRNRVPLSCAPCRHRKLKCNRGHPCDNCTKRGDTQSCSYATPKNRKANAANGASQTPDDMQNRIDKLEGMILSLMGQGGQPGNVAAARAAINSSRSDSISTASDARLDVEGADVIQEEREGEDDSEVERVSKGLGVMKMDGNKTMYASESHWYAILAEVNEVKQFFASHKEELKQQYARVKATTTPAASFLLQGASAKDKNELLSAFPPKVDSDRLIARYFNAYDPSVHVIHGPSFQTQYDAHWNDPNATSVAWLGMCFAMMTLALQSYHRAGDEPPEYKDRSIELSHEYRRLTAQCIMMSDMTQPIALILETLILHIQAEYGRSRDAEPGVLLMTSLCVRLAMRMGYHRDPGPHPQVTPFQGEIRRRVWAFVRKTDLLISFQFGMPCMIRSDQTDTQLPRNLYDDELHEDMKALPPSRPAFQATPMTYMIAKSNITYLFGRIVERVQSITDPPSYEETMRFDRELREVRSMHPQLLQMRSFNESARDPANLIMQRIGLELVYLRSLFVLHRRFIARGRDVPRYAYSRRTCIDASMEMLSHQATLHEESLEHGRLRSVKWYISSLTTHDFLLAAGLVCLDLYHVSQAERRARRQGGSQPQSPLSTELYAEDRKQAMIAAVDHCIAIWETIKDASMEAYKASSMLKILLEKIKRAFTQVDDSQAQQTASQDNSSSGWGILPFQRSLITRSEDLAPEQSAAMTLGLLSGTMSPGPGFGMAATEKMNFPAGMAGILNDPMPERTGLTPNFPGEMPGSGLTGGASPFGMFGVNSGFTGLEALGNDVDWSAWDSYIQGNAGSNAMDNQMWPMNDVPDLASVPQGTAQSGAGVFMGASTPGESRML
ncbi:hypothetical protein AMS68_003716 [Peltaster fructicola]|uniref:Zn(2)-C6 fungal-type domain-containing protein n=1 Tax=Peltaster fructicola TaxID=286661 RepID=A0A6H0XUA0_9PEZI|nr:hypothetical protein AMS68_003716 [Peltaster fructicola]